MQKQPSPTPCSTPPPAQLSLKDLDRVWINPEILGEYQHAFGNNTYRLELHRESLYILNNAEGSNQYFIIPRKDWYFL